MKQKAIVFDLDGVICFTDKYHYQAWKALADELGIYFDEEINNRLRGVSRMASFEIILERYHGEPLTPEQKEALQAILQETLQEECSLDVVQTMHETVSAMIEEQKADKNAEALCLTGRDVKQVLENCGVSQEKQAAFEERYAESFGEQAAIPAVNVVAPKQFRIDTPNVSIKVDPEHSDLVETRMIDGRYYIVILADGDVEVNGMRISC